MANDKNFKIKNGLSAKRYLLNGSTLSGSTIDLSLASVFSTTLSSDPAYTFTNPPPSGTAQAFSVEVTGGTTTFTQDSFATTIFTGTGSAETVNNGLDLAGDGGLVWLKARSTSGYNHTLYDTERSGTLFSDSTNAASDYASEIASYNSNGFTTVSSGAAYNNVSGVDYVSWSFKKQAKFFDIVTYTGTSTDQTQYQDISHNLGTAPIEDSINEHPAVAESAIVGFPHDVKGNALYGYVILKETGESRDRENLRKEINQQITEHIGPIAKLDKIQFVSGLPKTRSGKIMRRILRKIASKETDNLGDTSTLLNPEVVQDIMDNVVE